MKTCLIVDDSQIVRKTAARILRGLGFATIEAGDGCEALNLCKESLPAIILLDWYMPHMNGLEFLHALRVLPDGAKPLVIFCTTENASQSIAQAIAAGADEYIMKPFDEDIIKSKLTRVGAL